MLARSHPAPPLRSPGPGSLDPHESQIAACNLAAGDYTMSAADDDLAVEAGIARAIEIMEEDD